MSTSAIALLVLVGLLLLTTLVAFGLGHKRWSWASVAASFLVALTLTGYLYLAARLLHFEWRWVQAARALQLRIHEVRDAKRPATAGPGPGRLVDMVAEEDQSFAQPAGLSLEKLRTERVRWERALERIDNWRGRHWEKATFTPPQADGANGVIEIPPSVEAAPADAAEPGAAVAEGDVEATPARGAGLPIDPGTTLYVFDETPVKDGGLYLGAFLVQEVAAEEEGRLRLTVRPTAPMDAYDRQAWQRAYDAVTVYEELPVDRWLAFSTVSPTRRELSADEQVAPSPAKNTPEDLADLPIPEPFREGVERHALTAAAAGEKETVPEAEWPALREAFESGDKLPGEAWAEVTFKDRTSLDEFLGLQRDEIADDEESLSIEVELGRAFELADAGSVTIRKVFSRRRLIDAGTLVHGAVVAGGDVKTEGLASLLVTLQREIAALEAANGRLDRSQEQVGAERAIVDEQVAQFTADLDIWARDVAAADKLAAGFQAEAEQAARRLEAAEQAVVRLGRELDDVVGEAARRIDAVAPPADRGATAPRASF